MPGRPVVRVLGERRPDDVRGEPDPAHSLQPLGGIVGEVGPLAGSEDVAHGAHVAHRDREALADDRVVVARGVTDQHRARPERTRAPRVGGRVRRTRSGRCPGGERAAERDARDGARLEERLRPVVTGEAASHRVADDDVDASTAVALMEPDLEVVATTGEEVVVVGHTLEVVDEEAGDVVGDLLLLERDAERAPHHRGPTVGTDDETARQLDGVVAPGVPHRWRRAERHLDVAHAAYHRGAGIRGETDQQRARLGVSQVQRAGDVGDHRADGDRRRDRIVGREAVGVGDPGRGDVSTRVEHGLLDAELARLGDPPRHHRLAAYAVLVLFGRLEHGDVESVARQRGRERTARDPAADDDHVGHVRAFSTGTSK